MGASAGGNAQVVADLTERWIGNPVSRALLRFLTKRGSKGRRADKILRAYAGLEADLSLGDRAAKLILSYLIDSFVEKMDLTQEQVKQQLGQGYWRKGLASVLEGLAWRGPEKPFTSYCPFLVVWNFTNACNLHCKHCYQDAAEELMSRELTTSEALKAVDTMDEAGVAYVAMSGGEPLIRRDFFRVAERIKEREMGFSLATNGTLLSKDTARMLVDLDCLFVQVSLDGMREAHDSFRGARCFDGVVEGIRNAVDSGMTVGVSMAVTKHNINDVGDVIDLTQELGADIFMHYNFIPVGRGMDITDQDISPEEREALLEMMASETHDRPITLLSTAPQYSRICAGHGAISLTHFDTFGQVQGVGEDVQFLAEFVGGCGTGRLYWALQPNGDLTPCVFIPIRLGNIMEDDFIDVWKGSEVLNRIRDRAAFKGNCGVCPSRSICGGCRARAYGYFGDVQEADPGCIFNKDRWLGLRGGPEAEEPQQIVEG